MTTMTKAVLKHTGKVHWTPPAIFKSSCEIDVRYFPFDQQTCFMKFGSWTYDGNQIDLKHISQKTGENMVDVGIDLTEYYPSVEWDILKVPAERHEKYYPCCAEPYPGRSILEFGFGWSELGTFGSLQNVLGHSKNILECSRTFLNSDVPIGKHFRYRRVAQI